MNIHMNFLVVYQCRTILKSGRAHNLRFGYIYTGPKSCPAILQQRHGSLMFYVFLFIFLNVVLLIQVYIILVLD